MKLRGFAVLAALGGSVVLAGAIGVVGLGSPDAMDADAGGVSVAAKAPPAMPSTAAMEQDAVAAAPVADAAMVDTSLLSPHPMLAPNNQPVRQAASRAPEPVPTSDAEVTASLRSSPALLEVKKAMIEPRLDRDGSLTVAHIAGIKASLRLSSDQEKYWVPVEAELREIARQLAAQKASGKKSKIALGADAAQRLYWAAGPLIMSLRDDQKQEARRLARAMGLEQVASLI
jgi:hypothetical protein